MNTIKFSKIENFTTEQHNLEIANLQNGKLFGEPTSLYTPCNLNISISKNCHNKCFYCINKMPSCEVSDEEYIDSLRACLKVLNGAFPGYFEATITGGEPTLFPKRLVEVMKLCNRYGLKVRTFSTTGVGFFKEYEGKPLCMHLIEQSFVHNINISRMSVDEEQNRGFFGNKNNLENRDIEKLASFFKMNDAEMRISCNILKGGVDNFEKMLSFVDFYQALGVDTVMFRELVYPQRISLKSMLNFDDRFVYVETLKGMYYDVDVYIYKDMLVKHYKEKEPLLKEVTSGLFFQDGILYKNFQEPLCCFLN